MLSVLSGQSGVVSGLSFLIWKTSTQRNGTWSVELPTARGENGPRLKVSAVGDVCSLLLGVGHARHSSAAWPRILWARMNYG